jgi:DNA-directed RNA polymerase specialized sigma24 family protein
MSRRPKPPPPAAIPAVPNIFDDVAVALVRRASKDLCRRRRFLWADREDIEQALFFALHRAVPKFDPAHTSWRSFAAAVIGRRAATLARDHRSPKRAPRAVSLTYLDPVRDWRRPGPSGDPAQAVPAGLDFQAVLASASADLRALVERLMAGERLTPAARAVGIARSTARGHLARLRERFEDHGLWEV